MKKKFFSKLLMVALVATVGAFSSCKDYDDDIADVRNQINVKASELQADYQAKIDLANGKITDLETTLKNLDIAYKAADQALKDQIALDLSATLSKAYAYTDAAKQVALDAATAAREGAESYAREQAAAAQAAAIAAAENQVAAAKQELSDALAKANEQIATQGKSIENLIKADETLTAGLTAAQARADEAYALADKANTLAEQNKANLEKAAADIAALQTALANLDGKAADKADVAKLQSDLAALQKTVNENVVNLSDYKENITKLTSDLAAVKDDLAKQVGLLGESIASVKAIAEGNVAKIESINDQLSKLSEANTQAHEQIVGSINTLAETVANNKTAAADALKAAVEGLEAKLAAANQLIETNDAAIRALIDTKASELKALIDGNTEAIVKNAQAIQKNADEQKAENTLMNNAIAKNAQDIVAQGEKITNINSAIDALKKALGDDTAATLKEYAASIAKSEALQAKLDAQGYSDAQDAAQNITIMQAIKDQAAQDAAAWKSAIDLAIENLVTTYKLASLKEYIDQTAKAAQTGAEANAAVKAQQIADKALQDANAYTDVLAQTLKDNYTTTTDMQAAIENAKKSAISQAYLDVLNTLLRDYDAWYNLNDENKMNLELTPTIIELTKAAVEKYGLTLNNAQDLIDATIEAGLTKPEGTGTYTAEGEEIMTEPGIIMAEILAAADALQQEFTAKYEALDLRLQPIETFLGTTLGEGEQFKAAVNAIIATSTTQQAVEALQKQLAGTEASGLKTLITDAAAQAAQNAQDVQKVMTTINNINGMFTDLFGAGEVTSNVDEQALPTFEENIQYLADRIAAFNDMVENLDEKVVNIVNENLGPQLQGMITSIDLFYGPHHEYYEPYNLTNHDLEFVYVIEEDNVFPKLEGIADKQFVFKKGMLHTEGDSVIVRVNPVTVKLSDPKVYKNLAILNSKGEDLVAMGIMKIDTVTYFNESHDYLTRSAAEDNNTGLWVVKFKLVDGEGQFDKFMKYTVVPEEEGRTNRDSEGTILYAIAAKNTDDEDVLDENGEVVGKKERYIASEYDLTFGLVKGHHGDDFEVNETPIKKIYNRYIHTEQSTFDGKPIWTDQVTELTWIDNNNPGTEAILEGDKANAADRYGYTSTHATPDPTTGYDNRQNKPFLLVKIGEDIKIVYPGEKIKGFYVTLDDDFALESNTSEVNAWSTYVYENVGFKERVLDEDGNDTFEVHTAHMFEGNEGTIKIANLKNAFGDIVGFRVHAVNLDGTLLDPDGRAFYIKFGEDVDSGNLDFTVEKPTSPEGNLAANVNVAEADQSKTEDLDPYFFNSDNDTWLWTVAWGEGNPDICIAAAPTSKSEWIPVMEGEYDHIKDIFNFAFKAGDSEYALGTYTEGKDKVATDDDDNMKNALVLSGANLGSSTSAVKVVLNNPNYLIDNETYHLVLTGERQDPQDGAWVIAKKIYVTVTKKQPTDAPELRFKAEQKSPVTFYVRPNTAGSGDSKSWNVAQLPANQDEWGTYPTAWTPAGEDIWHAIDAKPYDFADIFEGLSTEFAETGEGGTSTWDKNFSFEFTETELAEGKKVSTFANYNEAAPHYSLPVIYDGAISKQLPVKVKYLYKGVSLTRGDKGQPVKKDYEVTSKFKFDAKFVCALEAGSLAAMTAAQLKNFLESRMTNQELTFEATVKGYLEEIGFSTDDIKKMLATKVTKVGDYETIADIIKNYDSYSDADKTKARTSVLSSTFLNLINDNVIFYETEFNAGGPYEQIYGTPNHEVKFISYVYTNPLPDLSYTNTDIVDFTGGNWTTANNTPKWNPGVKSFTQMIAAGYYIIPDQEIALTTNLKDYFEKVVLNEEHTGLVFITKSNTSYPALTKDLANEVIKVKYYDVFRHEKTLDVKVTMKRPETTLGYSRQAR